MRDFEAPVYEVIRFNDQDVIVTSSTCDLCAPDCQEVGPYPDH